MKIKAIYRLTKALKMEQNAVNINGETHFSSKTYTFDEKIDLTIRRSTFMG